jgi:opacity protein-like surface antigen
MKSLIFTILILLSSSLAVKAQFDYRNIYGGGNVGIGITSGELSTYVQAGIVYNLELGYKINDRFSVGIEIGQIIASGTSQDTIRQGFFAGDPVTRIGLYTANNYLAKCHYRLTTGKVQPFIGLGIGASTISEPAVEDLDTEEFVSRNGFAISPEIGVSFYGVIFSYSYSYLGRTPKETIYNFRSFDLPVQFHQFSAGYNYNF